MVIAVFCQLFRDFDILCLSLVMSSSWRSKHLEKHDVNSLPESLQSILRSTTSAPAHANEVSIMPSFCLIREILK